MNSRYADIILPLPVQGTFTYRIPEHMDGHLFPGSRVIVQFGKRKFYSGIVRQIHAGVTESKEYKEITEVSDTLPLLNEQNIRFWDWLSGYYMCSQGEVMRAALPSGLCLESETLLSANQLFQNFNALDNESSILFSIIEKRGAVRVKNLPEKLNEKGVIRILNRLILERAVIAGESITEKYKPREEIYIVLSRKYPDEDLNAILDSLKKRPSLVTRGSFFSAQIAPVPFSASCLIVLNL